MGQAIKSALHAFLWILPPQGNSKLELKRWRYGVFLTILGLVLVVGFLTGLAFDKIPGFDGFARASAVENVSTEVAEIKVELLEDRLLKMRERQCKAIDEQNAAAMRFAAEQMQQKLSEYQKFTGTAWRIPDCEELI